MISHLTIHSTAGPFLCGTVDTDGSWCAIWLDSGPEISPGDVLRGDFSGNISYPEVLNLTTRQLSRVGMERWHDSQETLAAFLRHRGLL